MNIVKRTERKPFACTTEHATLFQQHVLNELIRVQFPGDVELMQYDDVILYMPTEPVPHTTLRISRNSVNVARGDAHNIWIVRGNKPSIRVRTVECAVEIANMYMTA